MIGTTEDLRLQNLEKTAGYNKYEQRSYDNLNNLYANVKKKQEA